jgi:hypothetical protein
MGDKQKELDLIMESVDRILKSHFRTYKDISNDIRIELEYNNGYCDESEDECEDEGEKTPFKRKRLEQTEQQTNKMELKQPQSLYKLSEICTFEKKNANGYITILKRIHILTQQNTNVSFEFQPENKIVGEIRFFPERNKYMFQMEKDKNCSNPNPNPNMVPYNTFVHALHSQVANLLMESESFLKELKNHHFISTKEQFMQQIFICHDKHSFTVLPNADIRCPFRDPSSGKFIQIPIQQLCNKKISIIPVFSFVIYFQSNTIPILFNSQIISMVVTSAVDFDRCCIQFNTL